MYAITTICSVLSALVVSVQAAPMLMAPLAAVQLAGRDVVAPPITSPNAETVWTAGETATVTWDTSDLPPESQITNKEGRIVLGYQTEDSMHLMVDSPLAEGFSILLGTMDVTVPDVEERADYIIVLFGDSGNSSPQFTISGGSASVSSSASTAPATTNEARETTGTDEVTALTSIISTPIPITGTQDLTTATGSASGPVVTETSVAQSTTAETVTRSATTVTEATSSSSSTTPSFTSSQSSESASQSTASQSADGTSGADNASPSNGAWKAPSGRMYTASSLCAATVLLALVF
ncbi:hypothetical protein BD626DRAFT_571575 [Schizophyllum amplum]|uniref:Yeast cell wall synthesis Kre9/Knh1-like N-terminal domain-containing protein n=1 Tax=Schizophyllum amplum TaxID=97359 RepID=A0A550C6T3_9AGAR|nr:hypothetical protein BD626DRAFT_571575 [Auriculariopsis ampla]